MKLKNISILLSITFFSIFQITFASFGPEFVTIYVHGTTSAVGLKLLSKFRADLAFGEPGIHHIDELPAESLLRNDALILQQGDSTRFDVAHFYTFGWSGKLSFKARKADGQLFYEEIKKLLLNYKKKYGKFPKIRVLTFSHGGNVALNMVQHLPFFDDQLVYLELIIVACPVQKVTSSLIEHDCIDKSYVISSTRDLLQLVDCYFYEKKHHLPCRFFDTTKQNCHQIKVMINGRGLSHLDLMRSFMIHLPDVLNFADLACCHKPKTLLEMFGNADCDCKEPKIIEYFVQDPEFRFYNGFNLFKVVKGERKKCRFKSDKKGFSGV